MTPEQIEQIIDMLAEKLGPMAEVVWTAYVRQAYLRGMLALVSEIVVLLLFLAAAGVLCRTFVALHELGDPPCQPEGTGDWSKDYVTTDAYNRERKMYGEKEGTRFSFILGTVAAMLVLLVLALVIIGQVLALVNPEYYAIQMLLGR